MCKISKDTIIRANEMTMRRSVRQTINIPSNNGEIVVSAKHCGVTYSQKITIHEIKASYGRSLKSALNK